MRISGNAVLHADVARVFEVLNDPGTLRAAIPGCERLEQVGPDAYEMLVTVGVGSIKGTYKGSVELAEKSPPHSFTLKAAGAGAPGTVSAMCRMLLIDDVDGFTRVEYDADAVVGGVVAGVGQRMLTGVARRLAGQFFTAMDAGLVGERAPAAAVGGEARAGVAGPAEIGAGMVPRLRPSAAAARAGSADWAYAVAVVSAAMVGAAAALGGVALGWALGRSRARRGG